FSPYPAWYGEENDGRWFVHAKMGEFYLEQAWLAVAEREFRGVLAAIPPGKPHWGRSPARREAAYGLARTAALHGNYTEALTWLDNAPGEDNNGCGNAHAAEAAENYPRKAVWTLASKPSPTTVSDLEAIMRGRFSPLES